MWEGQVAPCKATWYHLPIWTSSVNHWIWSLQALKTHPFIKSAFHKKEEQLWREDFWWYVYILYKDSSQTSVAGNVFSLAERLKSNGCVDLQIDSFFVVVGRTQEWRPSLMLTEFKARPLPCIFCLVAHKSKIVCQAEMSGSWQDAPVTFQLERASVLQPSGQISNNRSSRKELSSNHKEVSGNLLDKLLGALWLDKMMFCWVSLDRLFFIAFRRSDIDID